MEKDPNQKDKAFENGCEKLAELWGSINFEYLTQLAKDELIEETVPVNNFDKRSEKDGFGVYCFWIEQDEIPSLEDFKKDWNADRNKLALSQSTKKWFSKNEKMENKYRAFYLGKRENVMNRIEQHINKSSKTTYGLHLYRNENWKKKMYVSWFKFPPKALEKLKTNNGKKELQQLILTYLESKLREEFNPMVGKQ